MNLTWEMWAATFKCSSAIRQRGSRQWRFPHSLRQLASAQLSGLTNWVYSKTPPRVITFWPWSHTITLDTLTRWLPMIMRCYIASI